VVTQSHISPPDNTVLIYRYREREHWHYTFDNYALSMLSFI